jgi:preprotein translocase subunit SecE
VAESKRRGEKAVDERLDDEVFDAVDDDATDDADEFDDDLADDDAEVGATKAKAVTAKGTKSVKPAKVDTSPGIGGRLARFIREIVAELRKVNWPSRKELITYTLVVLVFVIVMASLVNGLDYGFAWLVSHSFAGSK